MSDERGTLELVSEITEFVEVNEYLGDVDVEKVLAMVVKLIAKPDVPPAKAVKLIVELQALAAKFAVLATYYQGMGKGEANAVTKKNMFYTLRDAIGKLADNLKYSAKVGM